MLNASIGATTEDTWGAGTNVTLNAPTTLTATRTVNTLRYTGAAGALNLGASDFNLETYGLLNGGTGLTVSTTGTGALTTPTGGGQLYITPGAAAITVSAPIRDNGGAVTLVKSGGNTLTLSGTNTYTGGTVLNAGTLAIGNVNHIGGSSANLTFGGNATLSVSAALNFSGGTLTVNQGANAVITKTANSVTTFATTTGAGNLIYEASGSARSLNLGNASGFTGDLEARLTGNANYNTATTIQFSSLGDGVGSALQFVGGTSDSQQAMTVVLTGGSAPLVFDNRVIQMLPRNSGNHSPRYAGISNNNASANNTWTINTDLDWGFTSSTAANNKELRFGGSNTGNNAFNGLLSNGTGSELLIVSKIGAGIWNLTNTANSYTGGTIITAGTLGFASGALGTTGAINASGGTLLWLAGNTQDISGRLAFTAGGTSTFHTGGNDVTFASAIGSSTTGNFVKTGLGTLTLQGSNTFTTGTKQLNGGGTLVLDYTTNDNRKLGSGALTLAGGTIVLRGGTTAAETASSTVFNTVEAGTFFVRDGGTAKINLNAFTVGATSVVSFSDDSMATTDRTNVAGILGAWFTVGNRWASNSTNLADGDIVGYTGATTLNLAALPDGALSPDINYDLSGGGTLTATRQLNTLRIESTADNQSLNLGANNLTVSNLTGVNALTGTSGGLLYAGGANGNYTITGTTGRLTMENGNGQTQLINVHSGTLTVDAIVGNGNGGFAKSGEGTLVFNKASGYSAATRVYQGVLRITGAGTLTAGSFVRNGAAIELGNGVAITSGATLNITGAGVSDGGALRNVATTSSSYAAAITIGSGGARINSDSGTLTLTGGVVTSLFNDVTFGGAGNTTVSTAAISGAGGFIKDGAGTATLSASNSYTGATTVSEGTLLVNGSTAAGSTVGVSSGATLGGTGTIGGAVNVSGVLSPGASIETLGSGTLSFANGSSLVHELDSSVATSVGSDLLKVTGDLNLTGTVGLSLSDLALTDVAFNVSDVFSVINYTGTWNGGLFTFEGNELADAEEFTFGLNSWRINYSAPTGGLNFTGEHVAGSFVNLTVIPEPSSVALLGTLGAMMLLRRRR